MRNMQRYLLDDPFFVQGLTNKNVVLVIGFFYGGWALHAAFCHDVFGVPVSHDWIKLAPANARWSYGWIAVEDRVIALPPVG